MKFFLNTSSCPEGACTLLVLMMTYVYKMNKLNWPSKSVIIGRLYFMVSLACSFHKPKSSFKPTVYIVEGRKNFKRRVKLWLLLILLFQYLVDSSCLRMNYVGWQKIFLCCTDEIPEPHDLFEKDTNTIFAWVNMLHLQQDCWISTN